MGTSRSWKEGPASGGTNVPRPTQVAQKEGSRDEATESTNSDGSLKGTKG